MTSGRNAHDKINELEQDRRELADEYVALKTNYLNTKKAFERVVSTHYTIKQLGEFPCRIKQEPCRNPTLSIKAMPWRVCTLTARA